MSEEGSREKIDSSLNSNESLGSNGSLNVKIKKNFLVNKPSLKRFRKVFGIWLSKFLIPLYKIILNPRGNFQNKTKEKIKIIRTLIEEILQTPKIEFFLNSSSFKFDREVTSLVFSILCDKFENMKVQEQELKVNVKQNITIKSTKNGFLEKSKKGKSYLEDL